MILDAFFDLVLVRFLVNPSAQEERILLIRLDAIGDYVLFRNFIESIRNSKKYRRYRLTLLGNILWKNLAESLDWEYVNSFIWVDRKRFRRNIFYRFNLINKIRNQGFETVINPAYSRDFYWGDTISLYSGAPCRIASSGDTSNMNTHQKALVDGHYTLLIQDRKFLRFEFERNRFFFESLLAEKIKLRSPRISLNSRLVSQEEYVVFFPGASNVRKQWPVEFFAEIADEFLRQTNLRIYICGNTVEHHLGEKIAKLCNNDMRIISRCGETTLLELAKFLAGARLLLSNDTSAAHIAAAVGTRHVLTLFAGNHYGRFWPYPKGINRNVECIMPDPGTDLRTLRELSQDAYGHALTDLSPAKVMRALRKLGLLH